MTSSTNTDTSSSSKDLNLTDSSKHSSSISKVSSALSQEKDISSLSEEKPAGKGGNESEGAKPMDSVVQNQVKDSIDLTAASAKENQGQEKGEEGSSGVAWEGNETKQNSEVTEGSSSDGNKETGCRGDDESSGDVRDSHERDKAELAMLRTSWQPKLINLASRLPG